MGKQQSVDMLDDNLNELHLKCEKIRVIGHRIVYSTRITYL